MTAPPRRSLPALLLVLWAAAACSLPFDNQTAVAVSIDPAETEVVVGEGATFRAVVSGTANTAVDWAVTGGTFEVSGQEIEWVAPEVTGQYTITATSLEEPTRRGTATVRVVHPPGFRGTVFEGYRGTAATLPQGMFVDGEDGSGRQVADGYDPFTGVSRFGSDPPDAFDGFGAFTSDGETFSFGIHERGEVDLRESRLFLEYVNEATRPIVAFDVEYVVEVWRLGERANQIRLKYNTERTGFSELPDVAATVNPRGRASGDQVGRLVDGARGENRVRVSVRIDLDELRGPGGRTYGSLAPGATAFFRWQYSNADGDDGRHRSALALSDIRITPVFADAAVPPRDYVALSFSHPPGFHRNPFELELSTSIAGASILYTVDGSEPDARWIVTDEAHAAMPAATRRRTFEYDSAIDIAAVIREPAELARIPTNHLPPHDYIGWRPPGGEVARAAVIRAATIRDGVVEGRGTATYFLAPQGRARYSLPVVSLAADRADLFGSDRGIYVPGAHLNYEQRGADWERTAHFELFDTQGNRPLAQEVGVRIHGGWTRRLPQKSLRLYARSDLGASRFGYRFFPSKPNEVFERILLRNGGNDWHLAMIRDATLQTLVQHLPFETQHFQPAIVFLNGEYWGIHALRDRLDPQHLANHHGIPAGQIAILENEGEVTDGAAGDDLPYREFLDRLRSGEIRTFEEVDRYIDLDGYLDYVIAQMYAANTDWPQNNNVWWRYKGQPGPGVRDGRWRWMMFDVDWSFGFTTHKNTNMIGYMFDVQHPWAFDLFRGLMSITEIRLELLQRLAVHLGTTFEPARVHAHIDGIAALVEPEVAERAARWNWPQSVAHWGGQIEVMRDFAADRPGILRSFGQSGFADITGLATLEITNLNQKVRLHTVEIGPGAPGVAPGSGRWAAPLFANLPVVLRADDVDLREVEITGAVGGVVRSRTELRFVLQGDARIRLP